MNDALVQIERVDEVCEVCNKRHTPKWLEDVLQEDDDLKRLLYGEPNPTWLNVHMFKKRAFVSLEAK